MMYYICVNKIFYFISPKDFWITGRGRMFYSNSDGHIGDYFVNDKCGVQKKFYMKNNIGNNHQKKIVFLVNNLFDIFK